MNNAVGAASLAPLRAAGVRLALGTDGFTASVLREALTAHLLQNHLTGNPGAGWASVPALVLEGNPALAAETFGIPCGKMVPGGPADLVVWDYLPPTPLNSQNFWGHLLFGLVNARAQEVFVAGHHVLSDGQILTVDEVELTARCVTAARRLWERF